MAAFSFEINREDLAAKLALLLQMDPKKRRPILLEGPPGTGKTQALHDAARALRMPFWSVQAYPSMTFADLIGGYAPVNGEWSFQRAALLRAWETGGVLVIDDIHLAGPDVSAALYLALDTHPDLQWTSGHGEVFKPAAPLTVCLTSNGTRADLDEPVSDRIGPSFAVRKPCQAQLDALDPHVGIVCEADYEQHANGAALTLGYRRWRSISDLTPVLGLAAALASAADHDHAKAQGLLASLAAVGWPEAIALSNTAGNALPSGAPTK